MADLVSVHEGLVTVSCKHHYGSFWLTAELDSARSQEEADLMVADPPLYLAVRLADMLGFDLVKREGDGGGRDPWRHSGRDPKLQDPRHLARHQAQGAVHQVVYESETPSLPVSVCTTPGEPDLYCQTTVIARGTLPVSTETKPTEESSMNVQKMIRELLESQGCTILETKGIWYVTTPEGKVWDMTVPLGKADTPSSNGPGVPPTG